MKALVLTVVSIGICLALPYAGRAADAPPANKLVLSVEDCVRLALKTAPELAEAQADIEQTSSKLDEAKSYRFPRIEALALLGPAPQANKSDLFGPDRRFKFDELTWFTSADATIIQPLYTFGKISENMKAATHGIEVDRARKQQRANEVVLKVKEYFYGLLLAREMKELVQEVKESLDKARDKATMLIEQGSDSADQSDIYKLDAFSGEVDKYKEEALKGEALALAAIRTRLGLSPDAAIDIDVERLLPPEEEIPPLETFIEQARNRRPEYRQISEGLQARAALVEAAKAEYYPDIFLGGLLSWAYADERDRIYNPYITDPFQHFNGGIALGARWKLDFGITGAKVAGERAQYNRLLGTKEYADANIPLQIKKYYLELKEAEKSTTATRQAYSNAKKWAVTALANFDFGVGPAKDIFEALQAYARMRASYFQSIYNYRIAQANLDYATGQQPAIPAR
ncbi:TolC family protein [Geobacter sp. SVR]|uniref:TolC family protein n=1 Tax=Geobacter sp. SVR TaxID=2495594 RepID=UPI00143F0365|nr:TolC family protein [Geobacter sp. SVR]BCS55593.1 RND transporter [Geobacter sp. SVR]GCF83596.1 RND transporter [Geobacter sp. SVR]